MDFAACYAALKARDHRFDGKFFVGVKTTGIYCRPICPARPKPENIEFFSSAQAAARAGYRACLRCRPEAAPLSPAWLGTSAVVQRALRAIAVDGFFESSEETFAEQFGVSARHLRRLFVAEVGQTPKQIAFNNRLGFARQLIVESNLPITQVAMTAGFRSLRRFNDAFKTKFKRSPRQLRGQRGRVTSASPGVELSLAYRPPFQWENLLAFFHAHQIAGVEQVTEASYARVFRINGTTGAFKVTNDAQASCLRLTVFVDDPTLLFAVAQRVRQMFDLDSDPLLIANHFRANRLLHKLWTRYPGLRLARGWDAYETGVGVILGQLVSMAQARALVAQVVDRFGERITHPADGSTWSLFPSARRLATADLSDLGTTSARRRAINEFARQVDTRALDLRVPQDPSDLRQRLLAMDGIGPWTAEYMLLRALGEADAFPKSDLILKRALEKHPDLDLEQIRPWRSYAAVYLWTHYAAKLSKQKGAKNVLRVQENPIAGRRTHSSRERQRTRRDSVGK